MASGGGTGNGVGNGVGLNGMPNQVIHIRGDSDSELQALFDTVLKPNQPNHRQQVPFRLRKLPDSFFNPPSTGSKSPSVSVSHSKENSFDSTLNPVRRSPLPSTNGMGLGGHLRAHSSPATLEQTYSVAQAHSNGSLGMIPPGTPTGSSGNLTDDPLPPGWEQAFTPEGRIYYINHITRSTTWEDPRKAQHQQILAAVGNGGGGGAGGAGAAQQSHNASVLSANAIAANMLSQGTTPAVGPLPEGWEQSITPEGEVYFINHVTCTTSWFDPRLPAHMQRPPVLQQQLNAAALAQATAQIAAAQAAGAAAAAAAAAGGSGQSGGGNSGGSSSAAGVLNQQQSRQQEVRLQQLQQERERLRMRQQEIMRQMDLEQARLQQNNRVGGGTVRMEESAELDPFLSGQMPNPTTPNSNSDYHSRQESGDSGLGMGPFPSMPNTPEDFLSIDDNMDTISENDLGVGASMDTPDITALADNVESTDDLVPTLGIEELSPDAAILLDEMQSIMNSRSDNTMTWL